jgi:arabinose-5-phosphate isomerase
VEASALKLKPVPGYREIARQVMESEARAILAAAVRLDGAIDRAVDLITGCSGKVIVTGVGKSGHLARKMAATLQSTGVPAVFLHPTEAAHGDLGVCQPGDCILAVSKSGATRELLNLVPLLRRETGGPSIGILGNPASPLAAGMDAVLDASVPREADPDGFLPSASSAVAMAVCHALVVALMQARGTTAADFARLHEGGQLGRNLKERVADTMHSGDEVAWVSSGDSLKQVVIEMSRRPLGAACVLSAEGKLAGLVTDGDVRRALEAHDDIRELKAASIMTASPVVIGPDALLKDALILMEDRPSQISVLPVVAEDGRVLGLLRIHDLYRPNGD